MAVNITYAGDGVRKTIREAMNPVQQAYLAGAREFLANNDLRTPEEFLCHATLSA